MECLNDNDIASHIRENDVTCVNFDKNYFYEQQQMVVNFFDKIFKGIIDDDPSFMFPLSCYFYFDYYKDYYHNFPETFKDIDSIVTSADPYAKSK